MDEKQEPTQKAVVLDQLEKKKRKAKQKAEKAKTTRLNNRLKQETIIADVNMLKEQMNNLINQISEKPDLAETLVEKVTSSVLAIQEQKNLEHKQQVRFPELELNRAKDPLPSFSALPLHKAKFIF